MKKSVKDLGDIKGKRALVRVDINVPLDADKNVTDDTRIKAIIPTVQYLKDKGAKIILMAHLVRPKGEVNPEFTLAPVAKHLSKVLGEDVLFVSSPIGEGADKKLETLKDGQVALLENIRYYKAEEAKDDDMTFAKESRKMG
jgi:phosphoglycerate kinase